MTRRTDAGMILGEPPHARRTLLPLPSATSSELPATSEDAAYVAACAHRGVEWRNLARNNGM
jgi:hypothetical protein